MKLKETLRIVIGAMVVYAACATDSAMNDASGTAGASAANVSSGSLNNPVSSAMAGQGGMSASSGGSCSCEAPKPQVDVEQCDKKAGNQAYAEHLYPGLKISDLAGVTALYTIVNPLIDGYGIATVGPLFADGRVAAGCPIGVASITFVKP